MDFALEVHWIFCSSLSPFGTNWTKRVHSNEWSSFRISAKGASRGHVSYGDFYAFRRKINRQKRRPTSRKKTKTFFNTRKQDKTWPLPHRKTAGSAWYVSNTLMHFFLFPQSVIPFMMLFDLEYPPLPWCAPLLLQSKATSAGLSTLHSFNLLNGVFSTDNEAGFRALFVYRAWTSPPWENRCEV